MFTFRNVALYKDQGVADFTFRACIHWLEDYGLSAEAVNAFDILDGALEGCDMLVMPGGADEPYAARLGEDGAQRIRDFVGMGGAYLGLCAGAYFACSRFEFNKGTDGEIIRTRPLSLFKGCAVGSIETFAPLYDETLATAALVPVHYIGDEGTPAHVYYHGGPYFTDLASDPDAHVIAAYDGLPQGQSAAAIYKRYGDGRVILCGPHPEVGPEDFAARLAQENNPQAFSHLLNGLQNLTTGRDKFSEKMLAMLLPGFLDS